MKYIMLLGGFIGFFIVMVAGFFSGSELWVVVLHSSIGCVFGGILFRIFHKVVASSVRKVAIQKNQSSQTIASNAV